MAKVWGEFSYGVIRCLRICVMVWCRSLTEWQKNAHLSLFRPPKGPTAKSLTSHHHSNTIEIVTSTSERKARSGRFRTNDVLISLFCQICHILRQSRVQLWYKMYHGTNDNGRRPRSPLPPPPPTNFLTWYVFGGPPHRVRCEKGTKLSTLKLSTPSWCWV